MLVLPKWRLRLLIGALTTPFVGSVPGDCAAAEYTGSIDGHALLRYICAARAGSLLVRRHTFLRAANVFTHGGAYRRPGDSSCLGVRRRSPTAPRVARRGAG